MSKNPLLPLAAVLAAVALVIWVLLSMHWGLGRLLLGGFLLVHGWVHVFFAIPEPAQAAAAGKRVGLTARETRLVGTGLAAAVAIGFLLAGLATILPSGLWPALVAISSVASLVLLAFFFSRQLILGVVIDAVLLWVVVAGVWAP